MANGRGSVNVQPGNANMPAVLTPPAIIAGSFDPRQRIVVYAGDCLVLIGVDA